MDATEAIVGHQGHRTIVLLSDGNARPGRSSPFAGRRLADLFADRAILPDDVDVVGLLYGATDPLVVLRPNITVLRSSPD